MITSVCSLPRSWKVITGSWDKTLRLWDVTSGECERVFVGHRGVSVFNQVHHFTGLVGDECLLFVNWSKSSLRIPGHDSPCLECGQWSL
jgi:WD40 repeat protein